MTPKVSVIVATYKRENELRLALESLAKQTYSNYEIVVVNDNADSYWDEKVDNIVNDFRISHSDVEVIYIKNEVNQGSAKTRNIGIERANGEYITFLDDDDIYLENKITNQVDFMIEKNLDYSITDLFLYNEKDKLIDKRIRKYIKGYSKDILFACHLKHNLTGTDSMMFKKVYLNKIGGFAPINIGDEFYLMQRAIEGDGTFGYLPVCDIKAYVHTGDGGLSSGQGKIDGENKIYEHKKKYFNKLSRKDVRFIKMRHYAVLAFAYFRMKKYFSTIKFLLMSMLASPFSFVKLIFKKER